MVRSVADCMLQRRNGAQHSRFHVHGELVQPRLQLRSSPVSACIDIPMDDMLSTSTLLFIACCRRRHSHRRRYGAFDAHMLGDALAHCVCARSPVAPAKDAAKVDSTDESRRELTHPRPQRGSSPEALH